MDIKPETLAHVKLHADNLWLAMDSAVGTDGKPIRDPAFLEFRSMLDMFCIILSPQSRKVASGS